MIPLVYHSIYSDLPLPPEHRYPINKYRLLYQAIAERCAQQSSWQDVFQFATPQPLTLAEIKALHAEEYVDALAQGTLPAAKMRRIGFPWSPSLMTRTLTSAGGTCLTARLAVEHGIAIHLSGGYHHAHRDFGSGFCLFNDLALAAHQALQLEGIDKVLIIDSDVHHGDGTATLCAERDDIVTLSFHCDKNFPARKPDSDIDIALSRETGCEAFLSHFTSVVPMAVNLHQPDLIIYDAGVDIHQDDELGYFQVSTQAIAQRDAFMFALARTKGIPMACVVGGGYRSCHADLVPVHMQLIEAAFSSAE
ncbi:histone deacetylase family protein [Vibrio sp. V39_P1S14PM300]|uniref:histone deacetylase family protein n=1 Tax=Vibrio sp. V39_P1S14PM300 TaxID=1938690 RepID=UPI0013729E74|nr:histone deacetylase [Vibrio sp. V39_P1S14PM300]NAX23324.1 histone deacetylase [Vibrio sp. V39_P1S14PM300]